VTNGAFCVPVERHAPQRDQQKAQRVRLPTAQHLQKNKMEDTMAKKASKNRASAKRSSTAGKRDLVSRPKASAYAKRTARGRFKEMDDVGRSQKADKPRKAKRTVSSGYGDQGDKRPSAPRKAKR